MRSQRKTSSCTEATYFYQQLHNYIFVSRYKENSMNPKPSPPGSSYFGQPSVESLEASKTKPRNLRCRISRLIRDGEAKIRQFADCRKLPIVTIDGLARPVLGSGLWDPIQFLLLHDDEDLYELDKSCGLGHVIGPNEASTVRAVQLLTSIMDLEHLTMAWTHTRSIDCFSECRDGAIIIAADRLCIPIRHYDGALVGVELFLPSPQSSRRK